jgi:hypothetical protein
VKTTAVAVAIAVVLVILCIPVTILALVIAWTIVAPRDVPLERLERIVAMLLDRWPHKR